MLRALRGTSACNTSASQAYEDVPGFSRAVETPEIVEHDYMLGPGRYVGNEAAEDEAEAMEESRRLGPVQRPTWFTP